MTKAQILASIDNAISEARRQGFAGDDAAEYADMELTGGSWHDELVALGADHDKRAALNALKSLMIERFNARPFEVDADDAVDGYVTFSTLAEAQAAYPGEPVYRRVGDATDPDSYRERV